MMHGVQYPQWVPGVTPRKRASSDRAQDMLKGAVFSSTLRLRTDASISPLVWKRAGSSIGTGKLSALISVRYWQMKCGGVVRLAALPILAAVRGTLSEIKPFSETTSG